MISISSLSDEWRGRAGEIVLIYDDTFARFVGIGSDDADLYYIADVKTAYNAHQRQWFSAVGAIEPLKGHLRDEAYGRLERSFVLAGSHPEAFCVHAHLGSPSAHWRQEGPDQPYCPRCDTNWVRRASQSGRAPRQALAGFVPGCACHHNCPDCQAPRQHYARGTLHPEREGVLCPACDAPALPQK